MLHHYMHKIKHLIIVNYKDFNKIIKNLQIPLWETVNLQEGKRLVGGGSGIQ